MLDGTMRQLTQLLQLIQMVKQIHYIFLMENISSKKQRHLKIILQHQISQFQ